MGSVEYMAATPRVEFSVDLAGAVVEVATALLASKRLSSFKTEEISVGAVWTRCENDPAFGKMRRAPTLTLDKALRMLTTTPPPPRSGRP